MLNSSKPSRRIAGRVMIVGAVAVALPLTASRAVDYVDVPVSAAPAMAPVSPQPVLAPALATAAAAVVQPRPVVPARPVSGERGVEVGHDLSINGDTITIDGQTKRWQDLTPAEKARVRHEVENARAALAKVHIDRDEIMRSVASIPNRAQLQKIQQDVANAQGGAAEAIRNLQQHSAELRAIGQDPDQIATTVREALQSVRGVDMESVDRSLQSIDRAKIAQDVAGAEQSVQRARVELDRMQARMDADPN